MKKILIIGATSAIAVACARLWARERAQFFLVGRDTNKLRQVADDLLARGASAAVVHSLDLLHIGEHSEMLDRCFQSLAEVDIALVAHGILSDQLKCQRDVSSAVREFETNATSYIAILTALTERMRPTDSGTIAVISSVAGDRGRASNYVYGAAKAAVSAYSEGLRASLSASGIRVLTVKPGPVATPMTAGMKLLPLLVATPDRVAIDIVHSVDRRDATLYTPWFWRPIMLVIRAMPEAILHRLPL